jgi:integrase
VQILNADGICFATVSSVRYWETFADADGANAPYIPAPPPGEARNRHLTRDEFKRLYMAAEEPHIRTFLALGVLSGLRNGAILSLTWDQVDAEKRFIRPTGGTANKKRADIRIGPDLMTGLRRLGTDMETSK